MAIGSRRNVIESRQCDTYNCYLGVQAGSNRFGRIHGRECPGDGVDRVQDPQGVLGS